MQSKPTFLEFHVGGKACGVKEDKKLDEPD